MKPFSTFLNITILSTLVCLSSCEYGRGTINKRTYKNKAKEPIPTPVPTSTPAPAPTSTPTPTPTPYATPMAPNFIFEGINTIDLVSDTSLRLNWTPHSSAVAYNVYDLSTGEAIILSTISGQSASSKMLTDLLPGRMYVFRVRAMDSWGNIDQNINDVTVITHAAPNPPTAMIKIFPSLTIDSEDPIIRISGVKKHDEIKLFSDDTCSTLLASGTAAAPSIDLSPTGLEPGVYEFYSNSTNFLGSFSSCSTASVYYEKALTLTRVSPAPNASFQDPVIKVNGVKNGDEVKLYSDNNCSTLVAFDTASDTSIDLAVTGLSPGIYNFYATTTNTEGVTSACSSKSAYYEKALTLTRVSPAPNASFQDPVIKVNGVKNGDEVKLYSDSNCSTLVASDTASTTSIDLTVTGLSPGIYSFYATTTNTEGVTSACSSKSASYALTSCPSEHGEYILINPNPQRKTTTQFCVAKYEMKKENEQPISKAAGDPWVGIAQWEMIEACESLGNGYALISNPEWMTIASEIESISANWDGTTFSRGWSWSTEDGTDPNTWYAPTTDAGCLYNLGDDTCGPTGPHLFKRTHTLTNGQIWDLAGNAPEFVDWRVQSQEKASYSNDGGPVSAWREWSQIDSNINVGSVMEPSAWQSSLSPSLDSSAGIGKYFAGPAGSNATALRGGGLGSAVEGSAAGIYSLYLDNNYNNGSIDAGFRCVIRY